MIYRLRGKLIHTAPNLAVVECGGVGYACKTTTSTLSALPKQGGEAQLYTYLHITDSALDLFGFATELELGFFKMMITVSGVGPKVALAILSDLTPDRLALCIASGDHKTLTRSPGVGNKLAQRIVLELKDKVADAEFGLSAPEGITAAEIGSGNLAEAAAALESLGYARAEAAQALAKLDPALPVEELIKGGLKRLAIVP
ncbi:Holliday junction branch migration protein RuvA [Clostridiaceae bacterium NSJ-31]|uniref:Holliday junction branch migration complex subunit RuvA n=1 Tax=Ligaoa zhengdingensis TaxID=2763658 RepID=A0A926DZN8_9FIRM|nr:Holliday junction branch migration protein RuvA [Ligaoa zhengdingensis]MBC8547076.1 Holliday junction branch migration protein RuvA [Ligaoa zhengdingensis]